MAGTAVLEVGDRYDSATVARFREKGWWPDRHLCDYLDEWAETKPGSPFVADGVRSATFGSFRDGAYRLAGRLRGLGVVHGDRVVVQLPNWVEFATAYVALGRIGAVLVPIMPMYRHDEAEYVINHSGAVVAITTGTFRKFDHLQMFRDLQSDCPALRQLIVARGQAGPDELAFDDLAETGDDAGTDLGAIPSSDAIHLIVYTSGTESKPKGCCHTWNTFGFSARALAHDLLRLVPDDVVFMPSPVAHSTGLIVGVSSPLVAGCQSHLLDVWEPNEGLRRIQDFGCTVTATATPFVRMAIDAYRPDDHDVASMRLWLCAGAPIPPSVPEEVKGVFGECRLLPLYGCSEVLAAASCTLDDPFSAIIGSDGRPPEGVQIRLTDGDGADVADDEEGEILYWGPGSMLGYWRDPERTAAAIDEQGWYHSSDLGRRVDGDYIRVTGRIKDLVIRGGTNISAREIEEHLDTHPSVEASAIVGYPDERLGEKACAFVVAASDPPPTLEELTDYLRNERRIAVHKLPERIEYIDALPMGATGKIQKFELRRIIVPE